MIISKPFDLEMPLFLA
uniref:Uncharacterized protein n=1 Tax=Moniliophthora roreri TaxID=221103 RepID=A0A0W0GFG3_MONRR